MHSNLQQYFDDPERKQETLAILMGVRQATVSRWVTGRVPAERVLKVSKITGISPEDLRPDVFTRESPC